MNKYITSKYNQMIRCSQLAAVILITVLSVSSCKKVAPEEVTTAQSYVKVTTIAGNGNGIPSGIILNGVGQNASFSRPVATAVDAAGNIYVADQSNHAIRKITPAGVVSTFAGNNAPGYLDGTGTATQFNYPSGIAIGADGNIYVGDQGNNAIRKITPAGVVSTYAGDGLGYADGPAASAKFNCPTHLAFDKAGNLYVMDSYNYVVRKITPAGIVSTIAGTPGEYNQYDTSYEGSAANARFGRFLGGLAVGPSGDVYVADGAGHYIWNITPDGKASTWAGNGTPGGLGKVSFKDGPRGGAQFNFPNGLVCDPAGNLYVADQFNNRIRKIDMEGNVTTLAGVGFGYEIGDEDGRVPDATINSPTSVSIDATGNFYITTSSNNIRKIETVEDENSPKNTWNNPKSWGNPK